jgi:hypothetical protein
MREPSGAIGGRRHPTQKGREGFAPLNHSEQVALGEAKNLLAGDDEVIEHPDLDQRERCLSVWVKSSSARLGYARRAVVREDHRR